LTYHFRILSSPLIEPVLVHMSISVLADRLFSPPKPMYNVDSTDLIHFCTIKSGFTQEEKNARHKR